MKIKLTPEFSYLAGLTKYRGLARGVGVRGSQHLQAAFLAHITQTGIAAPDKISIKGSIAVFYHSAYQTFLKKTVAGQVDSYCHHNDYAAAFLAGLFDSVGGVVKDGPFLIKWDAADEMVLQTLGFGMRKSSGALWIGPSEQFFKFIKNFRRIDDSMLEANRIIADLTKRKEQDKK